jgi:general secretion pathway protein N
MGTRCDRRKFSLLSRTLAWESMSVRAQPTRLEGVRIGAMKGCGLVGLALLAIACGHSRSLALAVTEPTDSGAVETTINPPAADQLPSAGPPGAPAANLPAGNPLWAVPLRVLNITRDRPLFSPSRRPPPPAIVATRPVASAPPAARPGEPDHPLLTLVGTIVGDHEGIGIFVDQTSKSVISMKTGQDHDGWTLRAVRERETVFEKHQREAVLALPARNATDPAANRGISMATALPGETWRDGDGRLISPPAPAKDMQPRPAALPAATWTDGDGRLIGPPVQN